MLDARWRRPVELASSVSSDGPFSETPPSEPQLIPGTLAACPTECTPRPRNLAEYRAACAVAAGEPVVELDACQVMPGMRAYHGGRFLTVLTPDRGETGYVELRLEGHGIVAIRIADLDAPVYCLAPTPDACHAPGAGAPANESTGAPR